MNHYSALGGHRRMDTRDLRELWQALARTLHPDKGGDAEAFARASVAWGVLKNPAARLKYDQEMTLLGRKCPKCEGEGRILAKQVGFTSRQWGICGECNGNGFLGLKKIAGRPRTEPA
jgi:DnaJ-class molecular chaperone